MASIEPVRLYDTDKILSVIAHPDILKTVTEGDALPPDVDPESAAYIGCYVDDELSAVFIFERTGARVCEIHAHVLPAKRHHSRDIGAAILRHFFDDIAPWAEKLTALIPDCYPNVIRYAESFGFVREGVNRKSYLHQGSLIDQIYLGATRDEVFDGVG